MPTNLDVVLAIFAATNGGDIGDAIATHAAPEIVVDWSASIGPHRGVYRGLSEVVPFYRDFFATWSDLSWEAEDARELPDGRVLVTNHVRAVGASGARVDARGAQLWTLQANKVTGVRLFQSRTAAEASL